MWLLGVVASLSSTPRAFYKLHQPTVAATAAVATPMVAAGIGRVFVTVATADTARGFKVSHFCGVVPKQPWPFIAAGGSLDSDMFVLR